MKQNAAGAFVTFLGHSGFFVELERVCLLFDYWQGPLPGPVEGKGLVAFASHAHHDHFNPEIFAYGAAWERADFVLGNDIRLSAKRRAALGIGEETFHRLGPDREETFQQVRVRTLRSTDAGVAFLVEAGGLRIYHAGDLNWWIWEEESQADNGAMTAAFQQEVAKLRDVPIDLAFLTLDGRQGGNMFLGFDYYLTHCDIKTAVPMHSFGDYAPHRAILEQPLSEPYRDKILLMTEPGARVSVQPMASS